MSSQPLLIRHLSGESIGRFPVWLMRQAGRYLPEYREIRQQLTFWEMATTPEVAAAVSLLPLKVIPVDAIIFFADILSLPYGVGVKVGMRESVGPIIFQPLANRADFRVFEGYRPEVHTAFVSETLSRIKKDLPEEKALLGFAGAPWTVGCYLVEGRANRQFAKIKNWMYADAKDLKEALSVLAQATLSYLRSQAKQGAHAVQLFDTWLSEMPRPFFVEHYLPVLNGIFDSLKAEGILTIYFAKNAHHLSSEFNALSARVLSVDSLLPLGEMEMRTSQRFSLQGNLDPVLLLGDTTVVRRQTRLLVEEARKLKRPAILNLGHGILPGTPVANVQAFVEEARSLWI